MRETRLSFIGDELVAGHGDGRALGWTGRVMARTPRDADILWTSLAVPGETTAQMSDRWGPEVARRSTHTGINRLVVGLGVADVLAGVSYARFATASVLGALIWALLWVGGGALVGHTVIDILGPLLPIALLAWILVILGLFLRKRLKARNAGSQA